MHALQIAAAGDVPDDDGAALGGSSGRTMAAPVAQVVHGLGDITVEAGEVDHDPVKTHTPSPDAPPILRNA